MGRVKRRGAEGRREPRRWEEERARLHQAAGSAMAPKSPMRPKIKGQGTASRGQPANKKCRIGTRTESSPGHQAKSKRGGQVVARRAARPRIHRQTQINRPTSKNRMAGTGSLLEFVRSRIFYGVSWSNELDSSTLGQVGPKGTHASFCWPPTNRRWAICSRKCG